MSLEVFSFYLREEPFQFLGRVWGPFTTYLAHDCLQTIKAGLSGLMWEEFIPTFEDFMEMAQLSSHDYTSP